jgi:signal transduction histidine kinase
MEAVGQLTGGIAHDFHNMLTAILTSLDRAARESEVTNSKSKKSILIATGAAERAAALTNQMLAFACKQPFQPTSVAVNELISNLSPLLKNALGEHGLALNLDPYVGNIWSDRNQLEQVLLNLAVNARDAMVNQGEMTITTRMRDIARGEEMVPGVEIEVADSGCGMSKEVQRFRPFLYDETRRERDRPRPQSVLVLYNSPVV